MAVNQRKPATRDPLQIFEVAFLLGCGWTIKERPVDLDDPPLAAQLTEAVNGIYAVWRAASPAERIEFCNRLSDDK